MKNEAKTTNIVQKLWHRFPHYLRQPALVRQFVLALIDVYGGILMLYFLLRLISGGRIGMVALISVFLPWALLPAFFLLPVTLYIKRWIPVGMLSISVVAFGVIFGALFLPSVPPSTASESLTVMTYNVADGAVMPDHLVSVIRESGADMVALEELGETQATAISQNLSDVYPYQVLHGEGIPGKGLLSRYPILESEVFYLQAQRLPYLRAVLAIDNVLANNEVVNLTVIIAHPPPPRISAKGYTAHPFAEAEIASVTQMAQDNAPSILLGDFNLTDQNDNYTLLKDAGFEDAFRVAGWGLGTTWPARKVGPLWPLVRIDYVWYTPQFYAMRAWLGPNAGSDHLPVLAELAWVEREN